MTSMLEALKRIEAMAPDCRPAVRRFPPPPEPLRTPQYPAAPPEQPKTLREPVRVEDHDRPYRDLAINILSRLDSGQPSTLLFAAAAGGAGATAAVARLAAVLAGHCGQALAVDVDFSTPRLAEAFGIASDRGVADVLWGGADWPDVVRPSGIEGLDVLPGRPSPGAVPPQPKRMARLLGELQRRYRLVLLDAGRARPEEAASWARFSDAAYLMVGLGETSVRAARGAARLLGRRGGRLLGSVLMQ